MDFFALAEKDFAFDLNIPSGASNILSKTPNSSISSKLTYDFVKS